MEFDNSGQAFEADIAAITEVDQGITREETDDNDEDDA